MNRKSDNARYHVMFRQIDGILWDIMEDVPCSVEGRQARIKLNAEYMKDSIAAYIDGYAAMLDGLLTDARFSRFQARGSNRPAMWKVIAQRISAAMIRARVDRKLRRQADDLAPKDPKRDTFHRCIRFR